MAGTSIYLDRTLLPDLRSRPDLGEDVEFFDTVLCDLTFEIAESAEELGFGPPGPLVGASGPIHGAWVADAGIREGSAWSLSLVANNGWPVDVARHPPPGSAFSALRPLNFALSRTAGCETMRPTATTCGFCDTSARTRSDASLSFGSIPMIRGAGVTVPDRLGATRKIIQFRLLPVGDVLRDPADPVRDPPSPTAVAEPVLPPPSPTEIEAIHSVTFRRLLAARDQIARRRELELVHAFAEWRKSEHGIASSGMRIPYAPEARDLRVDLYVPSRLLLVEAKASASREQLRQAIGQLLDYRRWMHPTPMLCILVPTPAPDDMVELLDELGIGIVWATHDSFALRPSSLLTTPTA